MTAAEIGERFTEGPELFDEMARAVFEYQRSASPTYGRFVGNREWSGWDSVPFLPVEAFKWDGVVDAAVSRTDVVFASSATGGRRSHHPVIDLKVYERSVVANFAAVFGKGPFTFLSHLPTYGRRGEPSSLLYMVDLLVGRFGTSVSRSARDETEFVEAIRTHDARNGSLIVLGTAFGLLDVAERGVPRLAPDSLVIETGGMKTYRREVTREELHGRLAAAFGLARDRVRSEYGMCEMLSQFYTRGGDVFYPPPWVRIRVVDPENPTRAVEDGYPGLLAIFDLANVHSISALLTSDLAIRREGGFEILGRADDAEIRGCNFLLHGDP
jgi:Acyl-protein synthetase, LuxE